MKTGLLTSFVVLATAAAAPLAAAPAPDFSNIVVIDTSMGKIRVELFPDKAPKTVDNFLSYVDQNFYDGTLIHRVVRDFVIQGGGHDRELKEKAAGAPVKNESANGLSNLRGTIAVARRVEPDSGTCQFFINLRDNTFLDRAKFRDGAGYCVFGRVVEGMDVVDAIAAVATHNRGTLSDVPVEDVVIRSVRREKK
jgi:cyclophilin family peptidyl-prolyl cis-trans isomerase